MTEDQRLEWQDLEERNAHSENMVFTAIDAVNLVEYRALSDRLVIEYHRDHAK